MTRQRAVGKLLVFDAAKAAGWTRYTYPGRRVEFRHPDSQWTVHVTLTAAGGIANAFRRSDEHGIQPSPRHEKAETVVGWLSDPKDLS